MKIKQDINFLEYPLWFPTNISKEDGYVWTDREGYIYRSAYKVPDKTDALILFYLLLKAQKQDYQEKLVLSQYEILKACGFYGNSWYYERLEDSLRRWIGIIIEFKGSFYDGKNYKTLLFHILDSAKIREEDRKVEICFNPNFLLKIKESTFFKYINFEQYKALKRPISLRLFEILCKNFKGREEWQIDLVKLALKLPISKRVVQSLKGEKEILFHSDVLIKIIPAINEINRLAEDKKSLESLEVKDTDALKIDYKLSEDKKVITFEKVVPDWVSKEEVEKKSTQEKSKESKRETRVEELLEMAKSKTKGIREAVDTAYKAKGEEYVKSNILYANEKATKNYGAFLKKCLKEDWGVEVREQESKREESEKALQEKKAKEKQEVKKTYEKLDELKRAYDALEQEEISRLEPLALEKCVALGMSKNFIPKIILMEKIVELHQDENHSKKSGKKPKIKAQ